MDQTQVRASTALIINPEGLVLAVSRKDDPNDFGLPGGKCEVGDQDPIQTAIREVEEETGVVLDRDTMQLVYVDMARTQVCACYRATDYEDSQLRSREAGVVKWVDYEELLKGSFKDYNRRLLRMVFRTLRNPL
jgi:8-oxo-dGTP pyrophosphatase MutT (NUDIX family)